MDRAATYLLAVFGAFAVFSAGAQEERGLRLFGRFTADAALAAAEDRDPSYSGYSALRLDLRGGDGESAKLEGSGDLRLLYGDDAAALRKPAEDAGTPSLPAGTVLPYPELKKLFVSVYLEGADLSLGRMIVNYGRGTVFSPADLFAAVDTADLALGRRGTDAVRLLLPLGPLSGADFVASLAPEARDGTAGGRFYGNLGGWDFGAAAFYDGGGLAAAASGGAGDPPAAAAFSLDLKGDALLGVSAEASARLPWKDGAVDAGGASYAAMLGVDYSLGGAWFLDLEYLAVFGPGEASGVFRGARNLFASLSWKADELTAADARVVLNLEEGAWLGIATLSRSIAGRTMATLYGRFGEGDLTGSGASAPAFYAAGCLLTVSF